ncbi:MAG: Hsp20 family protein [Candidatus Didemnitutus sp.]|nr:Hsp20 family protein [Candidatus Didemnitutus sp.]
MRMHPIIPSPNLHHSDPVDSLLEFRQPQFECTDLPHALKIEICIPGVDAAAVEITTRGPDLVVVAHKPHPVRVNWQALHLEAAQRDYQLNLRLGHGLNLSNLTAEIASGVLTIIVPKRHGFTHHHTARFVA